MSTEKDREVMRSLALGVVIPAVLAAVLAGEAVFLYEGITEDELPWQVIAGSVLLATWGGAVSGLFSEMKKYEKKYNTTL